MPLVEWLFIFLPIIFHAVIGFVIIRGGLPNTGRYAYGANWRYTLQRATGVIAFFFIFWHVFHMHGWFHTDWWLTNVAGPFGGANFKPYNASSTLGHGDVRRRGPGAVRHWRPVLRVPPGQRHLDDGHHLGRLDHSQAQKTALAICTGFGVLLGAVGLSALWGTQNVTTAKGKTSIEDIRAVENRMYEARDKEGERDPQPAQAR